MESRYQRLFLALALICCLGSWSQVQAQEEEEESEDESVLDAIIEPGIERRKIVEDRIDSEDFEFGMFGGIINIEDFGSQDIYGARMAFLITEDFFLELTGASTEAGKTSFEVLGGTADILAGASRTYTYYNLSLGVNLLQGEVYVGKHLAFNTAYYIIAGSGNTLFADNEYFTNTIGSGFKIFLSDWAAMRLDVRSHVFTHNLLGEDKSVQNLEAALGLSIYF